MPLASPTCRSLLVIAVLATCGCGNGMDSEASTTQKRPLAVIISGDTAGWIVPCGCASNQSGGLPRRGSFVAQASEGRDVIYADAGGAPGGTSEYETARFEAILKGELAMGLAAHNLGGPEIALGADALRRIADELDVPFVSANVHDAAGEAVVPAYRIVEAGGRRIALLGVVSPRYAAAGCTVREPRDAILATIAEIDGKSDALIVLAYLPEQELRELAAVLPEATAVVGGPTGQALAPERVGATLLAAATNKGKFLVELTAPQGQGTWSGRVVEMSADFADDLAQTKNVRAFRDELARRDFAASETGFAPDVPADAPAGYRVAGSESCRGCHQEDHDLWHASGHAHAWETLTRERAHVDAYCQQCHTTGYGLPGGFVSVGSSADRVDVGCESCHGPSAAHVDDPEAHRTPFAARDLCITCHDRENSPQFEYAAYWERIVHGTSQSSAP